MARKGIATTSFNISFSLLEWAKLKADVLGMTVGAYISSLIQREKDNMSNSEKELFEKVLEARNAPVKKEGENERH